MKTRNLIVALLVIIVVFSVSALAYDAYFSMQKNTATTSQSFPNQPVGDVIIAKISKNIGGGEVNLPLNLTAGERVNLTVSFYLQEDANVSGRFAVLAWPHGASNNSISATLNPMVLSVKTNQNASTVMTMNVLDSAPAGLYTGVVSFQDVANLSYSWGTNVQINVDSR